MPDKPDQMAVFIVPRPSTAWKGAEAIWVTIHGWATAAEHVLGQAVVITSDKKAKPSEILHYPLSSGGSSRSHSRRGRFKFVPDFLKVFVSDLLLFFRKRNKDLIKMKAFKKEEVEFVWEQHDLFFGPGRKLANRLGVPHILYVHAPIVWEASKWGVKRYLWGKFLSKLESRSLRTADCVAVVSREVKEEVIRMGVNPDKVLISPMAVDEKMFFIDPFKKLQLKKKLGLHNNFVVGWTGSFRNFHGLDILIKSFANFSAKNSKAILLLVGDGALRNEMEELVANLGISNKVVFTGRIDFAEIPAIISVFDIALVGAPSTGNFHYSPLKLREYMAAGKAVLAPNVGEIPNEFEKDELQLYTVGNVLSLAEGMDYLFKNKSEREQIACRGQKAVLEKRTWEKELRKALQFLKQKE